MKAVFILGLFIMSFHSNAQDTVVPYAEIPEYPETFTAGNVVARMIDGLGYRFHWATEGLRPEDLMYKPSDSGRNALETMQHIYRMSFTILNAPQSKPNGNDGSGKSLSYNELRTQTLANLKAARALISDKTAEDLKKYQIIFQNANGQSSSPFWHMLNGMLADCIYHTGQIVLLRRSSGNPQNPNVDLFTGKTKG